MVGPRAARRLVCALVVLCTSTSTAPALAERSLPPEQRWIVTTTTAQGPEFEGVLAPTRRAAMLRVAGSTGATRDVRVTAPPSGAAQRTRQWALSRVSFERAWSVTRGRGVVVGVVDTGVDASHPDLRGRVLPGWTFAGAGSGDHRGQDDGHGHGTHVAGIIAARGGAGAGVSGAAPDVRILPARVLDDEGGGWSSDIANGIVWVANRGARVINLSLGLPTPSPAITAAVQHAQRRGAVVVAAAGNDGPDGHYEYPATLPGVLTVGAVDPGSAAAPFSTTGPMVDVVAPGLSVVSTLPRSVDDRGYGPSSGTSMAAPYAAAAAALLRSAEPSLSAAQVVQRLEQTAEDLGPAGRDDAFGAGLIDPARALGGPPQQRPPGLDAPTGTRVRELADGRVELTWDPVPGARGYEVLLFGAPLNLLATEEGLPPVYTLHGTTARFPYFPRGVPLPLEVVAVDPLGLWSPRSAVLKALVLARPVPAPRVTGSSTSSRTISLRWAKVRAPDVAGYAVLRNGEVVGLLEAHELSFTDSPRTTGDEAPVDGRRYAYRVVTVTDGGESDPSNVVVARSYRPYRTSAPVLSARRAADGVRVSWSRPVVGQLGWRVYVDGTLRAQVPTAVRSHLVDRPGRHRVTVVRYSHPADQGPRGTLLVDVPRRARP